MRLALAGLLNAFGNTAAGAGRRQRALRLYKWAAQCDPDWSVPHFNLGLYSKLLCRWEDCFRSNRRVTQLKPDDEGAWWNLGIAATALHDWATAREAWRRAGIEQPEGEGEVLGPPTVACARLTNDEVVWGERLDPARLMILSVPLPGSGRRFRDIVLHDGFVNGQRAFNGADVPVFDELELWRGSPYSTYEVTIESDDATIFGTLAQIANERGLGVEDWSTMRWICEQCSRGNPGPHSCGAEGSDNSTRRIAISAERETDVRQAVGEVVGRSPGTQCLGIDLVLAAGS